jgi:hydrogenase maturation factor
MAIPSLVVSLKGDFATVECFGVRRTVSTVLMPEPVFPGDYVSVLASAYAVGKVSPETAAASLAYIQGVLNDECVPLGLQ